MSFELAWPQRNHRVRFRKPIRVEPLVDGPPHAYRVMSGNLSKDGMFLSMPEPPAEGTKVALSLEAGGRVLPFAQAEVRWRRASGVAEPPKPNGSAGFGVRFTNFLHPRAHELVGYLVTNLDTGRPLALPKPKRWKRVAQWAAGAMASGLLAALGVSLAQDITFERVAMPAPGAPEQVAAPVEPTPAEPAPAPAVEQVVQASPAVAAAVPEPAAAVAPPAPEPAPPPPVEPAVVKPRAPAPVALAAMQPAAVKPTAPSPQSTGLLPLPRSGASSMRWAQRGEQVELEVTPSAGAKFANAFRLKNPERLVIDLQGTSPKRSHVVKAAEIPHVSTVRIGKRKGGGTRLVLDLDRPGALKVDGSRLELAY